MKKIILLAALLGTAGFTSAQVLITDFLEEYFAGTTAFVLDKQPGNTYLEVGEAVYNKLNQYKTLKADYLDFWSRVIKSQVVFDHDILLQFFEKLPMLLRPLDEDVNNWQSYQYDHFKLIIHELFLYTVGLALKFNEYYLLRDLLHSRYLIKDRYESPKNNNDFTAFRYYYETMDQFYKKHSNKDFYSPQADYVVHNLPEGWDRSLITNADLLMYFVGALNDKIWFPITYIYRRQDRDAFDIISRLVSRKHFEKVKGVFGIEDIAELKLKLQQILSY